MNLFYISCFNFKAKNEICDFITKFYSNYLYFDRLVYAFVNIVWSLVPFFRYGNALNSKFASRIHQRCKKKCKWFVCKRAKDEKLLALLCPRIASAISFMILKWIQSNPTNNRFKQTQKFHSKPSRAHNQNEFKIILIHLRERKKNEF